MLVRLTSALQRASSVYAVLHGPAGHPSRDLILIPPSFCIASIRFISSLQLVNTISVCLTSSPRPNDYFIAFLCSLLESRSYFNNAPMGNLIYSLKYTYDDFKNNN